MTLSCSSHIVLPLLLVVHWRKRGSGACPLPSAGTTSPLVLSLLHSTVRQQLWMWHQHTQSHVSISKGLGNKKQRRSHGSTAGPWNRLPPLCSGEGSHLPPGPCGSYGLWKGSLEAGSHSLARAVGFTMSHPTTHSLVLVVTLNLGSEQNALNFQDLF